MDPLHLASTVGHSKSVNNTLLTVEGMTTRTGSRRLAYITIEELILQRRVTPR